jgi:hypothetical protein
VIFQALQLLASRLQWRHDSHLKAIGEQIRMELKCHCCYGEDIIKRQIESWFWFEKYSVFGALPGPHWQPDPVSIRLRVHHFVPTTYLTIGYRSPGAGQPGRRKAGIGILGPDPYYRKTFG